MKANIILLPGDGIGPEVTGAAHAVLAHVARMGRHEFTFSTRLIGGCSIDASGVALTDDVLAACAASDAVLLGAVGGPRWDDPGAAVRPEQGLLALRKGLSLYANLRPVRPHPLLLDATPLKPDYVRGVDVMVVRELTGGLYFGRPRGRDTVGGRPRAFDTMEYYEFEIRRVVECAFRLAGGRRKKVTSVDKANVLETSRLWRQTAADVAKGFPGVTLEHMLVDTASMRLISNPAGFDVLVTENMFGDILTDEASVLAGSMGLLPSASIGDGGPGLYEPIHGSAPDIAGKGIANPVGAILSAALLLRHSLRLEEEARAVERAVDCAIADGCRTRDIRGTLGTEEVTQEVIRRVTFNGKG
ncbi:MAG TPA: 3-isopropylmalate dehydrogenase [Bacteroidota bacterium]|nr:3-isopropylmalate dehydrogenase [Bacteroidota bacterium]